MTPPDPSAWTAASTGGISGTKTLFASTAPLLIGAYTPTSVGFDGDIGFVSIRNGGTTTVLGGTEVYRLDADSFVDVSPDAATITPSLGGVLTVRRAATPKDTGYIRFPGSVGNFLEMPDSGGLDLGGDFSIIARITPDRWNQGVAQVILSKWGIAGQRSYIFQLDPTGHLKFQYTTDGTTAIALTATNDVAAYPAKGLARWVAVSTWMSGNDRIADFLFSDDAIDWEVISTATYKGAGSQYIFNSTEKLVIGQLGPSNPPLPLNSTKLYSFQGRIWEVAAFSQAGAAFGVYSSYQHFRIGSEHLAISAEATSFPAHPGTVTVRRNPTPVNFGVWYFPGTRGNYLQVPDAANLRVTNNLVADVRIVPDDWTPKDYDRVLIRKNGTTAGTYGWQFLLTPTGRLKLTWSTNGTALNSVESTVPVPLLDYYAKRVAFSYTSTDKVRFWIGDDGETWTQLGADLTPNGTIFASTAVVQIGVEFKGSLTNASIRNSVGAGGVPALGTEVFLMDQSCLAVDSAVSTFTATSGQTVTVVRDDVSIEYGEIVFPGTKGNYLESPDHASLDITGSFTVLMRIAPNDWNPPAGQTLISKWTAGQRSFTISLSAGETTTVTFTWTGDGDIAQAQSLTSSAIIDVVDSEYRFIALTIEMGPTKTLRLFETRDDGNSWIPIGATATTAFGSNTIFSGTAPLQIGAVVDTQHYAGRLSYVSIRNGIGTGGVPGGTEVFRIDAETLHIPPQSTDFNEVTGKNVVLYQEPTPAEAGYVNFYGVAGEYLRVNVPTFDTTGDFTLITRLDLADPREEQNYITPAIGGAAMIGAARVDISEVQTITATGAATEGTYTLKFPDPDVTTAEIQFNAAVADVQEAIDAVWADKVIVGGGPLPTTPMTLTYIEKGTDIALVVVTATLTGDPTPAYTATTTTVGGLGDFDPRLTEDVFLSALVTLRAGTEQYIAAVWSPSVQTSWAWYIGTTGGMRFAWSEDGSSAGWEAPEDLVTKAELTALGGYPVYLGLQIEFDVLGESILTAMFSENGVDWVPLGTPRKAPLITGTYASDFPLTIGATSSGQPPEIGKVPAFTKRWRGDIQWVQMHRIPDETLVWRFDADEWSAGTEWTDGRGKVWGLEKEAAMTLSAPAGISSEQVIVQKWNETDPATNLGRSFSLRRTSSGFKLYLSQDGKSAALGADISVANTAWPSKTSDPDHRWGWFAITVQFTGAGVVIHSFIAEDARSSIGTPLAPVWEEHGTGQTSTLVTAMYTNAEQVTIGATEVGGLPFVGSIAVVTLSEGVGTDGVPGGTAVFNFDMDTFFELAPDTPSFTADTGQVVTLEPVGKSRLMYIEQTPPGPIAYLRPSPPGPPLSLLPAPAGPTTEIEPSSPGPVAVIVPSTPGPSLEIVGPSLDRSWWPGSQDSDTSKWWQQPAFTVQRTIEGVITGGDYVRGSTNALTEATAIRFPRFAANLTPVGPGGGILYVKPYDYDTIQVEWNVPEQLVTGEGLTRDPWQEVVIVRSAFGNPSTVNDGQTIFRMTKDALWPTGDYSTDRDGKIITPDVFDPRVPEQSGEEPGLPNGRWYYYGLFFKVGLRWIRSMVHHTLLPRNHHHDEHLWNALPPYYRYLDEQQRGAAGPGDLQQYLRLFGFSFDLTKEYVESWLDLYHTDFTPMTLLRNVGENVGSPYEPGIGDIRYRALIARIGYLYQGRGTAGALRQLIAATSKCDCDVDTSPNIFLLPDDADFFQGVGNWVGLHPDTKPTGVGIPTTPLHPKQVHLDYGIFNRPGPNETTGGRGSMHVWTAVADATADIIVTCGDGLQYLWDRKQTINPNDDALVSEIPKELLPRVNGINVTPNDVYGFSIWVRTDVVGVKFMPMVMYFDKDGLPDVVLDYELGQAQVIPANATTWYQCSVSGAVPTDARYAIPTMIITSRPAGGDPSYPNFSRMVHFAGASAHVLGTIEEVASVDPDRYITLSGPVSQDPRGEEIGPPREDPDFPGYLLGDDLT